MRHSFVDDYNNINIFLSLENPCTFLLAKEKTWKLIFNTSCELSQHCTEKQIMPPKTTINWPFNDICYLFIACFDWKIDVFQQTVVRVCYILKFLSIFYNTQWCKAVRNKLLPKFGSFMQSNVLILLKKQNWLKKTLSYLAGIAHLRVFIWKIFISPRWQNQVISLRWSGSRLTWTHIFTGVS